MSADGSIIIDTDIDDKNAQQKLNRINKKIQSLENQLASKNHGKLPLEENLNSVNTKLQEAQKRLSMLKEEQSAINAAMSPGASPDDYLRAYSDKDRVNEALKQQKEEVDAIEKEWKQADRALSSYNSKISGLESKLNQAKVEAGGIYQQVSRTVPDTNKMAKSVDRAQKSAAKFSMRLREVIRSALVFTIITQALAKFREWMGKVIKTNDEARAAIARLKGALLTLAQPLIEVIIPAFTKFVDILARIIAMAARFTAALFGTTAEKAADSAENLYEETEAIEGTGEAAEKAEKSLASFDEINQLAGGDKGKEENKKEDKLEDPIEPDFSIVKNKIQDALSSILELLTGAALLALGAILVFTGASIPIGLALMVAGALAIADAITSNPEAIKTLLQGGLGEALSIIGPLVAVIGVLLVVTGHILLGIALIILGATIWAVGTASGDEGDFVQNIITRLSEAAAVIGPLIAVLGVFLVITGHILLGVAFIIAGAALWAVGKAAGDEGDFIENIKTRLSEAAVVIGPLIAVLGVLLVIMGNILMGVAFIILGAALWSAGKAAGDEGDFVQNIITRLQEAAEAIGPWIAIIGIVLLVAGQIPLGIGLIVLGIAIFALGKMDMDGGESLIDTIVSALSAAMVEISPYIAIIGLVLILVPGMQAIGIALLIAGIGLFIAGTAMAASNDNEMKSWVEVLQLDKVEQWVSTALLLAGIALVAIGAMTLNPLFLLAGIALLGGGVALKALNSGSVKTGGGSFSAGSGAGRMSAPKLALADVPMLAKGAVIPPNREFLAVLGDQKRGTNIEAPTSEIEAAVARGIQRSGMGGGSGDHITILQIGEQEMARVVYRLNNQQTQRIGVRLAED
nr:MAG TPA: minor tail protein [Caudoviricetes sp.]